MPEPELRDTPFFDLHRCWARRCDDDARHTRRVGAETVRFCDGHAEVFDYQVAVDLQRLQDAAGVPLPSTERKESA